MGHVLSGVIPPKESVGMGKAKREVLHFPYVNRHKKEDVPGTLGFYSDTLLQFLGRIVGRGTRRKVPKIKNRVSEASKNRTSQKIGLDREKNVLRKGKGWSH